MSDKIGITIEVDTAGAVEAVKRVSKETKKLGDDAEKAARQKEQADKRAADAAAKEAEKASAEQIASSKRAADAQERDIQRVIEKFERSQLAQQKARLRQQDALKQSSIDDAASSAHRLLSTIGGASGNSQLSLFGEALGSIGVTALAVSAPILGIGAAFAGMAIHSAEATLEVKRLAQLTGTSVSFLSSMEMVAAKAQVSQSDMATSLEFLNEKIGQSPAFFDKFGFSVKNSDGSIRSTQAVLVDFLKYLDGFATSSERAAAAQEVFGRSAKHILPILDMGSASVQRMISDADKSGQAVTTNSVQIASAWKQAKDELSHSFEALARGVGDVLLPVLASIVNGFTAIIDAVRKSGSAVGNFIYDTTHTGYTPAVDTRANRQVSLTADDLKGLENPIQLPYTAISLKNSDIAKNNRVDDARERFMAQVTPGLGMSTGDLRAKAISSMDSVQAFSARLTERGGDELDYKKYDLDKAHSESMLAALTQRISLTGALNKELVTVQSTQIGASNTEKALAQQKAATMELLKAEPDLQSKAADAYAELAKAKVDAAQLDRRREIDLQADLVQAQKKGFDYKSTLIMQERKLRYEADKEAITLSEQRANAEIAMAQKAHEMQVKAEDVKASALANQMKKDEEFGGGFGPFSAVGLVKSKNDIDKASSHDEFRTEEGKKKIESFRLDTQKKMDQMANAIGSTVGSSIMGLIKGTETLGDVFKGVLESMLQQLIAFVASGIVKTFLTMFTTGGISGGGGIAKIFGFADGGYVTGGVPGKDSVPAMLMPGEYVLPAKVVSAMTSRGTTPDNSAVVSSSPVRPGSAGSNVTVNHNVQMLGPMDQSSFQRMYRDNINPSLKRLRKQGVIA